MEFHRTFIFCPKVWIKRIDGIPSKLYFFPKRLRIPSNLYLFPISLCQKVRCNSIETLFVSYKYMSKGSMEFHRSFIFYSKVFCKRFYGIPSNLYFFPKRLGQKLRWKSIEPLFFPKSLSQKVRCNSIEPLFLSQKSESKGSMNSIKLLYFPKSLSQKLR